MIRALAFSLIFSINVISFSMEVGAQECPYLENRAFAFSDLRPGKRKRGYICLKIFTPKQLTGVLTVRSRTPGANWNLLVGKKFDHSTRKMIGTLKHSKSKGNADEVATLPTNERNVWEAVIYPTTSVPSRGCLIYHNFNPGEMLGKALVMATAQSILQGIIEGDNPTKNTKRNASRIASLGISAISGQNFGETTYNYAMSEVSGKLAEAVGGGSWLFSFGLSFMGDYIKEVGRYTFSGKKIC